MGYEEGLQPLQMTRLSISLQEWVNEKPSRNCEARILEAEY